MLIKVNLLVESQKLMIWVNLILTMKCHKKFIKGSCINDVTLMIKVVIRRT